MKKIGLCKLYLQLYQFILNFRLFTTKEEKEVKLFLKLVTYFISPINEKKSWNYTKNHKNLHSEGWQGENKNFFLSDSFSLVVSKLWSLRQTFPLKKTFKKIVYNTLSKKSSNKSDRNQRRLIHKVTLRERHSSHFRREREGRDSYKMQLQERMLQRWIIWVLVTLFYIYLMGRNLLKKAHIINIYLVTLHKLHNIPRIFNLSHKNPK